MSATSGLARQADGLQQLLALASLNARDIAAAGEETRRQMQLTAEEQAKVSAARAYFAKHEALEAAMKAREDALATSYAQLELDKKQHAIHVASENTRLEAFSAKVDERMKQAEDIHVKLEKDRDTFTGLKLDHTREHNGLIASCQRQEATNTAVAAANADKENKLKEWESTLKRKAELLRQQMANF